MVSLPEVRSRSQPGATGEGGQIGGHRDQADGEEPIGQGHAIGGHGQKPQRDDQGHDKDKNRGAQGAVVEHELRFAVMGDLHMPEIGGEGRFYL
ncbi:MAG: hypothetical protein R3D85_15840 [Paracoccaceae bacterium]